MKMFNPYKAGFLVVLSLQALAHPSDAQEIFISPLGKNDYGDWKATGTAFQKGPASGELLNSLEIQNAADSAVASSEIEGDGPMGTLTSPEFKISRRYIAFRIGGGNYEFSTCLHLLHPLKSIWQAQVSD
jgi:fructan beta-fructosidase